MVCNCAVDVSMAAGADVTSTVVVTAPTCSVRLIAAVRFNCNCTPPTVAVANPGAE